MAEREQLRELHDAYAWKVNAAIDEDRPDLVRLLADCYVDEALRLITDGERGDCTWACATRAATKPRRRLGHWRRPPRG